MNAWQLGARMTASRLRGERAPLLLGCSVLVAALCAYLERSIGGATAVDRALTRDTFGILLPLVGYSIFQRATRGGRLDSSARVVARHGVSGRRAWLGAALPPTALLAALGTAFAVATVCGARGLGDPGLARDLWQSTWVGAIAGTAYGAWLAFGSDFGRHGAGRKWVLLFDLLLGSASGNAALFWPRAHIRSLLGGEPLLGLGQGTALAVLLAGALTVLLVALRRAPD